MKHRAPSDAAVAQAWDEALSLWGVTLRPPELVPGAGAKAGSFAWFDFPPHVHVDPTLMGELEVTGELATVFAHEIGHFVLAPATRIDALKMQHQMARALAATGVRDIKGKAPLLANLWADLLVNTRIHALQSALLERGGGAGDAGNQGDAGDAGGAHNQRPAQNQGPAGAAVVAEPGMVRLWRLLRHDGGSRLMWVYLRASEHLWRLPSGSICSVGPPVAPVRAPSAPRLAPASLNGLAEKYREKELVLRQAQADVEAMRQELSAAAVAHPDVDARSLATLARSFAHDPVSGALAFGLLAAPYVAEAEAASGGATGASAALGDGDPHPCTNAGAAPTQEEMGRVLADRRMWEAPGEMEGELLPRGGLNRASGQGLGLANTVALYGAVAADAVALAWYRSQALPHVRPWSTRSKARPAPELPGPLEQWESGDDLADIDWQATLQASPVIVPGVTTRRRAWIDDEPIEGIASITLDLYVDSSGSMPSPSAGSPAVLAGAILCLSILKGGGAVRVTSFSGPGQVVGHDEYSTSAVVVLTDLLQFLGGGTSFPLDLYGDRYRGLTAPRGDSARHVVVLSDDGLSSMFGAGNAAHGDVAQQVRRVLTTGTLVLLDRGHSVESVASRAGYSVIYLDSMNDAPAACAKLSEVLRGRT